MEKTNSSWLGNNRFVQLLSSGLNKCFRVLGHTLKRFIAWFKTTWLCDLMAIYTLRDLHKILGTGMMVFGIWGFVWLVLWLNAHYFPLGAIAFWSMWLGLVIGAETVRKQIRDGATGYH